MAKVDAEDWLNDENENALIDMWQTNQFVVGLNDHVLVSCSKLNIS